MKQTILKFIHDERGLTTVEYAVAGGLIALAVIGAFTALGGTVGTIITSIDQLLQP
jgi:pilus assembly protein Flp/PilA